jgi:hypothetical protein
MKKVEEEVKPEDIKIPDDADQPPEGYTLDEWSDLSDAEKAGILDSIRAPEGEEEPEAELSQEEKDALTAVANEGKTDDEIAAEEEAAKLAEENKGKAPEELAAIEEADKAKEAEVPEATDETLLKFRPTLTKEEEASLKVDELDEVIPVEVQTKLDELKTKFDDGDLTADEYQNGRDKLQRQIIKHNMTLQSEADAAVVEKKSDLLWKKEQIHFLNSRPEYLSSKAVDSDGKVKSNALFGALNEMVKSITSDPVNAKLSGMEVLVKADKEVKKAFGFKPPEKKVSDAKTNKPPAKKPDVKTLGNVPQAATNQEGIDDSFALIDKLTGEAYENALERMSDKTREAYLSRAGR